METKCFSALPEQECTFPSCCKAKPRNASDSRRSPPVSLLYPQQWLPSLMRPPALQAAVRTDMFTKLSAILFASPCTVQKILQQELRGKKDKLNLPLTVKLTRAGFFPLAHLKKICIWVLWSVQSKQAAARERIFVSQHCISSYQTAQGLPWWADYSSHSAKCLICCHQQQQGGMPRCQHHEPGTQIRTGVTIWRRGNH